jgi:hypothetical protein
MSKYVATGSDRTLSLILIISKHVRTRSSNESCCEPVNDTETESNRQPPFENTW